MSVDIGQAVEEGGKRTVARNGLFLVAIMWVVGVLNGAFSASVGRDMMASIPGEVPMGAPPMGPSLGLSPGVAGLLSLVVSLVAVVVAAAAMRTFVTADTESLPRERFTRNIGWMLVNLVVGGIIFGIVVGIGFVLLVIPGVFLLISLFFWSFYVAVEDENFVDGFKRSWSLTSGNRLMLLVLGIVVAIIAAIISWVFGVVQLVGMTGWIGLLIAQVGAAFAGVFTLATAARAFRQLTDAADAE